MENNQNSQSVLYTQRDERTLVQTFFTQTYGWMFLALLISAVAAFAVISSPTLIRLILGNTLVFYGLFFLEFGIVIFLSARIHKMSVPTAVISLLGYALVNGLTLSIIFFAYSFKAISVAFIAAALIYGLMALYGTLTKSDLSPIASFLFIALLGGIIISLINIFILHSSTLDFIVSLVLIFVFAGLTAYDHQKLKEFALQSANTSKADVSKMAVYGALQLYLDFINIFLLLLRLFSRD